MARTSLPPAASLFALTVLLSAGCSSVVTREERLASFAAHDAAVVGSQPVRTFLLDRTGVLIRGAQIKPHAVAGGGAVQFEVPTGTPGQLGFGSVTAIDRRGYFLTASHCVANEPVFVLLDGNRGAARLERAHVVWRGDLDRNEPDVAILRIARPLAAALDWATAFNKGDAVLAAGLDYDQQFHFDSGWAAGKITRIDRPGNGRLAHELIYHHAPLHAGDSGGPLTTTDGKLIGINTGAGALKVGPFSWVVGRAERPDVAWMRQLIEEDFARSPSRPAETSAASDGN